MYTKMKKENPHTKKAFMYLLGALSIFGMLLLSGDLNVMKSELLMFLFIASGAASWIYFIRSEFWNWKNKI